MTKDRPPLTFTPNLGFGLLELRADHGGVEAEIPSWLVDQPEVLAALAIIAQNGGTEALRRARDSHDVIVDTATATLSYAEPVW